MDKLILLFLLQLSWLIAPAIGLGASSSPAIPAAAPSMKNGMAMHPAVANSKVVPAADPAPVLPAYQTYNYYGDRYRDPFIPLTGDYHADQGADRPPQISTLLLKGVIQDVHGRVALLTSGASSYILRGGRLYDGRNHLMKGISGVVKTASVVLMGSDHTVRELKVTPTL